MLPVETKKMKLNHSISCLTDKSAYSRLIVQNAVMGGVTGTCNEFECRVSPVE